MSATPVPTPEPAALYAQAAGALSAKDRAGARQLLATLVMVDPRHEEGWLLLSTVVDDVALAIECLQHVIALNPTHTKARHWLRLARENQSRNGQPETGAEPVPELPMDDPAAFTALDPADQPVPRLGRYLLDYHFVTAEQLAAGLAAQAAAGRPRLLGDILIEQGGLVAQQLAFALREQARVRAESAREQPEAALS